MLPTRETTALDVYAHALSHGDHPVIHGAEIDYDDVHDGVHYHADLLAAAWADVDRFKATMMRAAEKVAIRAMLAAQNDDRDPRGWGEDWAETVAEYATVRESWMAAVDRVGALQNKQDAQVSA